MATTSTSTATSTATTSAHRAAQPQPQPQAHPEPLTLHLTPFTLPAPLLALSPDGEPTYAPKEDGQQRLTRELRRLWARGDYAEVTEAGVGRELQGEGMDVDDQQEEEEDGESVEEGIRPEELWRVKQAVLSKLHEAMQQTLTAQTLLALLSHSAGAAPKPPQRPAMPPPPPPPIPLDGFPTMTATLTTPPGPAPATQLRRRQLAAGLKNASLRRAARLFEAGAGDIERALEKEAHYFERALALREHWRLAPRAAERTPRRRPGKEPARDFAVYYGMEGAPLAQRAAAVAHLSPTSAQGELLFPSRTGRRLRVSLTSLSPGPVPGPGPGLQHLMGSSALELPEQAAEQEHPHGELALGLDLDAQLRDAQREVLEREVFHRLAREAMELVQLSPVIRERVVSLRPLPDLQLTFELVDPSDAPAAGSGQTHSHSRSHSPAVQLLAALLPLLHLPRTRPSLLQPLLKLLQYLQFSAQLTAQLAAVARGLTATGVPTGVQQRLVSADGAQVWKALLGEDAWAIGGEVRLALQGCAPILLAAAYPADLVLHTPRLGVHIAALPELGDVLAGEILARLSAAFQRVGNRVLRAQAAAKADEAEWTLGPGGKGWAEWPTGAVGFRISLSPAFDLAAEAVYSKRAVVREGMSPATPGMGHLESMRREWPEVKQEEDMEQEGRSPPGLVDWFEKGMKWVTEEE
ncbi:hypothetical protein CALCODRAFT_278931 [Calocera cornea HHB12733]|uniref:Mediator of RNA polymerase II transcription subunit 17 n=1 Tax=Calocera cornea HHB12733 TaxID=1353952 RepID=A0A165JRC2_9BASI|nr:hypothetical protein CALCODRAFT_278931 [Calocera cornea HHB12733]